MAANSTAAAAPEGFGASHTSIYTSAREKTSYPSMEETLAAKMPDEDLRSVVQTLLSVCATVAVDLNTNLATVADDQDSQFGDVQLKVDMIADRRLWDAAEASPLIMQAASEEAPELKDMVVEEEKEEEEGGKKARFTLCWDPLDGSSIVDNNWYVSASRPLFSLPLRQGLSKSLSL